ncbi:transcriptional regulator [Vulcanimicrobium alpinum]|uniref:Transcriptional regulator n=1 Tax=Vulcanimicrobium alpinum TaxID=3016050 RepID=A0AAN1XTM1_UNVUL|nr:helix-turn-helix domain-containing protein [Vulcanimicrobium alpinum]BDE05416.1 transcriptional regulator [Vulcanimicrobium alpinum]
MHLRTCPANPPKHAIGDTVSAFCPRFQYAIELLGRRWVGAVLRVLIAGPARFNEILTAIPGLSDRLLTERLRELETEGLITRTVSNDRPVRVTYTLTTSGSSLTTIVNEISTWAERWVI